MTNKPMLSVELLPCPFCGGKNLRQYSYNPGMDVYYRVQCYCLGSAQGRTPDEAVEEWNKRYPRGQGDPVAIVTGSTVQWLPGAGKLKDRTPLYAEQPVPVAVVMPGRKTKADYSGYIEQFQSEAAGLYNSALDDVARLNGVKP